MQGSVHLRRGEHHDHRVHEVGAVSEPRQGVDQPEGEQLVDEGRSTCAALDHDETHGDGPGGVPQARVHRARRHAQVVRVQAVDQGAHYQRRTDPAGHPEELQGNEERDSE